MGTRGRLHGFARALAVSACLAAACISSCRPYGAHPESPGEGAPAWHEVRSAHFRVLSDLSLPEIQDIVRDLETGLAAIEQISFRDPRSVTEPTTVVVFEDRSDMHHFIPRSVAGTFENGRDTDLQAYRRIVFAGGLSDTVRVTCLHELTHDLFDRNFGPAPPWLDEGVAQFYSTTQVVAGNVVSGGAMPNLAFTTESEYFRGISEDGAEAVAVPIGRITPPSRLLAMDRRAFYSVATTDGEDIEANRKAVENYLGSWVFVHMLFDGPSPYPERYQAFSRAAAAGRRLDDAWETAFAGITRQQMDRDVFKYLLQAQVVVQSTPFRRPPEPSIRHRLLEAFEVHLLWAQLLPWSAASDRSVRREFERALHLAPASPDVLYSRGVFHLKSARLDEAEADLLAAVAARPDDARIRLAVLHLRIGQRALGSTPARMEGVKEAARELEVRAKSAYELAAVSAVKRALGESDAALDFAVRATRLAPVDPWILDELASALARAGRMSEACVVQERAVSFLPEDDDSPDLLERLVEYRARARAVH